MLEQGLKFTVMMTAYYSTDFAKKKHSEILTTSTTVLLSSNTQYSTVNHSVDLLDYSDNC